MSKAKYHYLLLQMVLCNVAELVNKKEKTQKVGREKDTDEDCKT